jgi:hypothetical protein
MDCTNEDLLCFKEWLSLAVIFYIAERKKVTKKTRTNQEAETEGLIKLTFIYLFIYLF